MTYQDMNVDSEYNIGGLPPEESSNRPFLIVAGILVAFTLIALACIAGYSLYIVPQNRAQQTAQSDQINIQNTEIARAVTSTALAAAFTFTPTATEVPADTPTATLVVAMPTATTIPTQDPRTATVAALLTQAAISQQTIEPRTATPTALPTTGFAEEVGISGLFGLALVLIVVIFLSRRLRTTS